MKKENLDEQKANGIKPDVNEQVCVHKKEDLILGICDKPLMCKKCGELL